MQNVFELLELDNAEELQEKSNLMIEITSLFQARKLTRDKLTIILGNMEKADYIFHGKISRLSMNDLNSALSILRNI